jgi:hypothetical protein
MGISKDTIFKSIMFALASQSVWAAMSVELLADPANDPVVRDA